MTSPPEAETNQGTFAASTSLPEPPKPPSPSSPLSGCETSSGPGDKGKERASEASPQFDCPPASDAWGSAEARTSATSPATSLPKAWMPPSYKELLRQREKLFTAEEKDQAWSDTVEAVKTYSDELLHRWNTEIDTYLVYAGLFSAIVTAFNVQSYLLLQPIPPDPALAALQQISLQLGSLSINPPFVNSTHPAFAPTDTTSSPAPPISPTIVALNALWFSSLVLSLSSASIGIMVKQWLNEFKSGLSSKRSSREIARLRQYRLNNLLKWHVHNIVLAIPVLLQLALAFFLTGLLALAWTLHRTVAAITTVFVALLAMFTLATMLLPSVKSSCAYLSPQALVINAVSQKMPWFFRQMTCALVVPVWHWTARRDHEGVALRKLITLVNNATARAIDWCNRLDGPYETAPPRTWHAREKEVIFRSSSALDSDLFVMAYDTSFADPEMLENAAIHLSDAHAMTVIRAFVRLSEVASKHLAPSSAAGRLVYSALPSSLPSSSVLWWNTKLCVLATEYDASHDRGAQPLAKIKFSRSARNKLACCLQEQCTYPRYGYRWDPRVGVYVDWSDSVLGAALCKYEPPQAETAADDSMEGFGDLADLACLRLKFSLHSMSEKGFGHMDSHHVYLIVTAARPHAVPSTGHVRDL
ncbi:hypothetical protein BV20DRAFT_982262 [Pilatotrama ljubarskyi]|nr:hypothetical protein BV20DRAFT_982262 [Pilatotrama ljubarskyi]